MTTNIYLVGTIDGGGDAKELLLAAINRKTNRNYSLNDFDFGPPQAIGISNPTHNTVVQCGPKLTSKYYGVFRVYYNRIHADELGKIVVPFSGQARVSDLLDAINQKYGILIKPADIVDAALPALPANSNQVSLTLNFSATSLIFYSGLQVQLGLNDPTGDTTVQEPYKTSIMAVMNQSQRITAPTGDRRLLDFYTLGLDRDNTRTNHGDTLAALKRSTSADYERFGIAEASYQKIRNYLPFVGMWADETANQYYAVSVLGDVYRCAMAGGDWTFVNNALGYNTADGAVVQAGYASPYVKSVTQGPDGSVYLLGKASGGPPRVYKGTVTAGNWTAQTVATTRIKSLTESEWNDLVVHDSVFSSNRLWLLISTPTLYEVHTTKSRTTPAVEVLNVVQGTSNYYPLAETPTNYSGIKIDNSVTTNRWRFVTPLPDAAEVDVVALITSAVNNNTLAVYFKYSSGGEYSAEVLPHTELATAQVNLEQMDIQAYKISVPQVVANAGNGTVSGHYLEVIEIITAVEVNDFNRYFVKTNARTQKKFLAYGLRTLTSIATRTARSAWHEGSVAFLGAQQPTPMVTYHPGRRAHYTVQNTVAIYSLRLRQIVGTQKFEPLLDATRNIQGYSGAAGVGRAGAGIFVEKTIIVDSQTPITLNTPGNDEASMAPIKFSFLAKQADGARVWFTAEQANTLLVKRQSSSNYAFLGGTPAAVLAEGSKLLLWSRHAGLYVSSNYGASWSEFNAAPSFYKQERAISAQQNIIGTAPIDLTSKNFGEGVMVQGKLTMHLKLAESVSVFDANSGNMNANQVLTDEMLFFAGQGPAGNKYTASAQQSGFGMNALSTFSPRRVLAWDTDAANNFEPIGDFTTAIATPYDTKFNFMNYTYGIPGVLLDFSRDVKYLGVRHWILMQDGAITKLHFTDAVQPTKTINLNGDPDSIYGTFMPEVNFHLWEYVNDSTQYAPYIFYGGGRVLLLEPIKGDNTFDVSLHVISIPGDNGQPIVPVKMYTANRRDYLLAQKNNGIFKFTYNFNAGTNTHIVGVQKLFDLTGSLYANLEFESGAIADIAARNAPLEGLNPDKLLAGTWMGWHCKQFDRYDTYADGNGGYTEVLKANDSTCGYVPPAQGTSGQSVQGQE